MKWNPMTWSNKSIPENPHPVSPPPNMPRPKSPPSIKPPRIPSPLNRETDSQRIKRLKADIRLFKVQAEHLKAKLEIANLDTLLARQYLEKASIEQGLSQHYPIL